MIYTANNAKTLPDTVRKTVFNVKVATPLTTISTSKC